MMAATQRALIALGYEIRLATLSLKLDVLIADLERRYRPDQPRAPRGIAALFAEFSSAFEEFKATNDQRLREIEKRGSPDGLAIETDAGDWEVIGFAQADLLAPGRYRLSRLLRGLEGTGPAMGAVSAGNRVLVPDNRVASLPVEAQWLGEARTLRLYAGSGDVEGISVAVAASLAPALPLPPVHLRTRRQADDVVISWIRCSRAGGDGWGTLESPLDHAPERYRLTIMDGATAVRVLEGGVSPLIYAAADQVADFGALPAGFSFSVAQLSPVLGAGHAAWGEFHG